jgi:hypothetical protein
MNSLQNIPIESTPSAPVGILGQCQYRERRRYTRTQKIEDLAVSKYNKNGKGITFNDLLSSRLVFHKEQAQNTLKRCLQRNILFTLAKHKPQQYYPTCLKAEISKNKMSKNYPIEFTGVGYSKPPFSNNCFKSSSAAITQSLEEYILPLLPAAPLHIHKIRFNFKITPECYAELNLLPLGHGNRGKEHVEIIGSFHVSYLFYPNGRVIVFIESSRNPLKLETEIDRSRLMAFFGQVRDRLIVFLMDSHERIVPDIMEWELTQCDINKDIVVDDSLQFTALKVQIKHLDHLFRIYIKSMGKDTVCRIEESLNPKQNNPPAAIQMITDIFNPFNRIESQIAEIGRKVDRICSVNNEDGSSKDLTATTATTNNSSDVRCQQVK